MRMLYWSEELAASAQRHADRCDFRHSRDRVNVGENIWAAPYANYSDAITRWFQEVNDPRCGCNHAYKHCCGHYIQVSLGFKKWVLMFALSFKILELVFQFKSRKIG